MQERSLNALGSRRLKHSFTVWTMRYDIASVERHPLIDIL